MKEAEWSIGMRQLNIDAVQKIFADKDGEIERLKAKNSLNEQIWEDHNEKIKQQRKELRLLLARAADELEKQNYVDGHSVRNLHVYSLIDELRKAL